MQYRNGRAVQVGDPVFGTDYQGYPLAGVVVKTMPEAKKHNIQIVAVRGVVPSYDAADFVHAEDVMKSAAAPAGAQSGENQLLNHKAQSSSGTPPKTASSVAVREEMASAGPPN